MKVVLKNVKYYESISEETNAFTANVYVDGKLCGFAKNDGHGGDTYVSANPDQRELFEKVSEFLKTQPDVNIGTEEKPYYIKNCLDSKADELFEKWLRAKEEKKIQNHCKKGLVYKTPEGYEVAKWGKYTIDFMLLHPSLNKVLYDAVKEAKDKGYEIVNTNIPNI